MPVTDDYIEYVKDLLGSLGHLRFKRMFGGAGVYCDDLFFAIIVNDELYLKVDQITLADYQRQGLQPFRYPKKDGKLATMNYYPLPAEILDDSDQLIVWANKALAVALRAKAC